MKKSNVILGSVGLAPDPTLLGYMPTCRWVKDYDKRLGDEDGASFVTKSKIAEHESCKNENYTAEHSH